jgi:peptidoglycan/LPS O-acetylase OafA/YrhL
MRWSAFLVVLSPISLFDYMASERFLFLDALRGVAAVFVFFRHTSEFFGFDLYRSYLAVDIFFVLSGFVLAAAYDDKLSQKAMSFSRFLTIRLVRLYPVFLISVLLSVLALISSDASNVDSKLLLSSVFAALFFLPSKIEGSALLFPLNLVYWSLLFELVVNLVYALIRPHVQPSVLFFALIVALVFVCSVACVHGNLNLGFTWGALSILSGISRAAFGFVLGFFLFRYKTLGGRISFRNAHWSALFVLIGVFFIPLIGSYDAIIDLLSVCIVFPLIVILSSQPYSGRFGFFLAFVGSASYPLYVLHMPMIDIFHSQYGNWIKTYAPFSGLIFIVFSLIVAVFVEKFLDIPLRKMLTARLLQRKGV